MQRLTRGVTVEGQRLAADRVRRLGGAANAWLELTLHEGKNREVRRLLKAVGHPVSKLKRVAFGPVACKGLKPGGYRPLTEVEVRSLTGASPPGKTARSGRRAQRPSRARP